MQLSNAPGKLVLPFAAAGGRNTIPVDSQISTTPGAASLTDGFPPLTRTPIVAGGVPPSGLDMNGVLYELSALIRWLTAGGGFAYDGTFAADLNVSGYPKGARVMRSDGHGYWLNTADNNSVDPESVTVGEAVSAGWVPDYTNGIAAIAMSAANVTLTPSQYGKPVIEITGTLLSDLNLIFPTICGEWVVINKCTGKFSVTCKTSGGMGVAVAAGSIQRIACDNVDIYRQAPSYNGVGVTSYGANHALTEYDANKTLTTSANNVTFTLPLTSSVPNGTTYSFVNGQNAMNLLCQGSDVFDNGGVTSMTLGSLDTLVIVATNGVWWLLSGSAALNNTATFIASLAASGHQRLPSGIILQWGQWLSNATPGMPVSVTFPITFPAGCFKVLATANNAQTNTATAWYDSPTQTGFNGRCNIVNIGCSFFAIGA